MCCGVGNCFESSPSKSHGATSKWWTPRAGNFLDYAVTTINKNVPGQDLDMLNILTNDRQRPPAKNVDMSLIKHPVFGRSMR